jgi:protein ImuB
VGSRHVIATADIAAAGLGLRPGLTIAQAQALVPNLHVREAIPQDDSEALTRLAYWCMRYAPIVAPDPPDGIWIDVAGASHLFGGEPRLLEDLVDRLIRRGVAARASVADAPGAAWAVCRFGTDAIVPPGRSVDAVATLPIEALRLPVPTCEALHRLGIDRIGQLAAMPRAPMTRRFGTETALRLDQAFGHAFEPLNALSPAETPMQRLAFAEPIGGIEDLKRAVAALSGRLCQTLMQWSVGARQLDLVCHRVDRRAQGLRVRTAAASRDAAHLAKLFDERLATIDPGFGIEEISLIASRTEVLTDEQIAAPGLVSVGDEPNLSHLVDRLAVRVGHNNVYRLSPVASRVPERSARRVPALAPQTGQTWPVDLQRPSRIIDPPQPIRATAVLPDHPPAFFIWRRVRHRVVKADGPERITGEWWRDDREVSLVRDYYRLESDRGARVWVFRDGPADEGGRWWLHGLFA